MSFSCVLCNLLSQELVPKNVLVKLFWVFCFEVTLWRKCVGFGKVLFEVMFFLVGQ